MIYDCSPPISATTPVWPGDVPYRHDWTAKVSDGSPVNISSINSTVHLGSHADAPMHCGPDGASIDECDIEAFIGAARVIEVSAEHLDEEGRITTSVLDGHREDLPPRVLFKTGTYSPHRPFEPESVFASLAPELVALLGELDVALVGIDTPSVDPVGDEALPSHKQLARYRILNLEGLFLEKVPPGDYYLIALPLKLVGSEASPVRAILRSVY